MLNAQQTIPLYQDSIPNSKPTADVEETQDNNGILVISKISKPSLSIFLPPKEKANGSAVLICPGGGYWVVAAKHEGYDVAKAFNDAGVAAFVLKYRIPDDATMINKEIGPLQDAQRALQIIRSHATEWNIKKGKLGIMGFSAGGHLASTAGTHYRQPVINNSTGANLRPDFMILIYPVISFTDSIGHIGSRDQLIGKNPSPQEIKKYSNEQQVSSDTPPTFLVHAKDDNVVPVQNSTHFYEALQKHRVPSQLFLYEKGGHGFGLNNKEEPKPWFPVLLTWMKKQHFL